MPSLLSDAKSQKSLKCLQELQKCSQEQKGELWKLLLQVKGFVQLVHQVKSLSLLQQSQQLEGPLQKLKRQFNLLMKSEAKSYKQFKQLNDALGFSGGSLRPLLIQQQSRMQSMTCCNSLIKKVDRALSSSSSGLLGLCGKWESIVWNHVGTVEAPSSAVTEEGAVTYPTNH